MHGWKKFTAVAAALTMVGGAGIAYGQEVGQNAPVPDLARGSARVFAAGSYENEFTPITPCRIVDTRLKGGKLAGGTTRTYDVRGSGATFANQGGKAGGCAIPSGTSAIEVTITAVGAQNGFLRVWPGGAVPNASFMGYDSAYAMSNTGTVAICGYNGSLCLVNNDLKVQAANGSTHVVIDVQGYYQKPMSAVVTAAGVLDRGSRAQSIVKPDTGVYRVEFDRDVSECQYSGNVGGVSGGDPNGYVAYTNAAGFPDAVFVHTFNATGASANREFHLTVTY